MTLARPRFIGEASLTATAQILHIGVRDSIRKEQVSFLSTARVGLQASTGRSTPKSTEPVVEGKSYSSYYNKEAKVGPKKRYLRRLTKYEHV